MRNLALTITHLIIGICWALISQGNTGYAQVHVNVPEGLYGETPAEHCHKEIVVESYVFISYTPSRCFQWTWNVSAAPHHEATLEFNLVTSDYQKLELVIYDGDYAHPIKRYIYGVALENHTGEHIYAHSGRMIIVLSTYSYVTFNSTVKLKGVCLPGTKSCGDGESCYKDSELCDGMVQCTTAIDELGCDHCAATEFWCGTQKYGSQCFASEQRCNGQKDCLQSINGNDEDNCAICGHGTVLCESENRCIFERWLCDQELDCKDGSDEAGCSYPASRRVITAAIVGALVCSLLLVISMGCTCKLYSLRTAHNRRSLLHTTPLTRVERQIFARQAPPTYDMTVSGVDSESRPQRNRRRRSRRYPFQRSAPARETTQANTNREEGPQSGSAPPAESNTPSTTEAPQQNPPSTNASRDSVPERRGSILQSWGSFLFESMRAGMPTQRGTSAASRPASTGNTQAGTEGARSTRTTVRGQSSRSSSRSRSSRSDKQAKPLPKKKRILPVMVPAPYQDGIVEEDVLACVYPTPPSYSQSVSLEDETSPGQSKSVGDSAGDASASPESTDLSSAGDENTAVNEHMTTQKESGFSFVFSRALRRFAGSPLRRFRRNPHLQMTTDSRRNSQQESSSSNVDSIAENGQSFTVPARPRGSTSSDEDLLDCTLSDIRCDDTSNSPPTCSVSPSRDAQTPPNKKVFPQKRLCNLTPSRSNDGDCDSINMFDLSNSERR